MGRLLAGAALLAAALGACVDFDEAYAQCVAEGRCPDAGPAGGGAATGGGTALGGGTAAGGGAAGGGGATGGGSATGGGATGGGSATGGGGGPLSIPDGGVSGACAVGPCTVTVDVRTDDGLGVVLLEDGGTFAAGARSFLVPKGSMVRLSVDAGFPRWFEGFSGACTGPGCSFTVGDSNYVVAATFHTANVIFATDLQLSGNLGGPQTANRVCEELARDAGLPDNAWRAFLYGSDGGLPPEISDAGALMRPDGKLFARSLGHARRQFALNVPSLNERGRPTSAPWIWTGWTFVDPKTCADWTATGAAITAGKGTPSAGGSSWYADLVASCTSTAGLYCMGTRYATVHPPTQRDPAHRLAFLAGPISGTLATTAEAACTAAGKQVKPSGNFIPYRAKGTVSAASLLSPGAPWGRVDGVLVDPTGSTLLLSGPLNPINLLVDGGVPDRPAVVFGARSPTVPPELGMDCGGFVSTAGVTFAADGDTTGVSAVGGSSTVSCGSTMTYVYCLEQ